jgi:hypothetical protein
MIERTLYAAQMIPLVGCSKNRLESLHRHCVFSGGAREEILLGCGVAQGKQSG